MARRMVPTQHGGEEPPLPGAGTAAGLQAAGTGIRIHGGPGTGLAMA